MSGALPTAVWPDGQGPVRRARRASAGRCPKRPRCTGQDAQILEYLVLVVEGRSVHRYLH